MLDLSRDIQSLTDFKKNTPDFVHQMKETGEPIVLTINGKAELVVQDAKSYQRLLDLAERLETIQAVKEGIASMQRGEGQPVEAFFCELESELRAAGRP
jgi:PHD/YefM family antitoxin component YafN of YafNO toxin-antitoxin module